MNSSDPSQQAQSAFVLRRETFGCLVYNRAAHDYIAFDNDALQILRQSKDESLERVFASLGGKVSRMSFDTFVRLCASIDIIKDGRFNGDVLDNRIPERGNWLSGPTEVYLQLTRYCNLACRHCWADAGVARKRELTVIEVRNILDQMAEMGVFILHLGGGEPFGRGDLADIVEYANKLGMCVNISTSATMATRAFAQRLGKLQVNSFRVSMEAGSEKSYDYIRDRRSYRKAIRGIRNLRESCPDSEIYFHVVLQKDNQNEIPAIIKHAEKLEMERIVFDLALPVGRALSNRPLVVLSSEEAIRAVELVRRIGESSRLKVEVNAQVPPVVHKPRAFEGFGCECGQLYCHISSDGTVSPNGLLSDLMPCGNVRESSLFDIWNSSSAFRAFRSNHGNRVCKCCEYYRHCRGGCRTRALTMLGDISERDPLCTVEVEEQ